jgi:hypothetical protein
MSFLFWGFCFVFCSVGDWTQGLIYGRQFYHRATELQSLALSNFLDKCSPFLLLNFHILSLYPRTLLNITSIMVPDVSSQEHSVNTPEWKWMAVNRWGQRDPRESGPWLTYSTEKHKSLLQVRAHSLNQNG